MMLQSLNDLFIHELKDLYSAEKQIIEALPKMASAASSPELKKAFEQHLEQTREHANRLQQILSRLGQSFNNVHCKGVAGLIQEGQELMMTSSDPMVKDAALITAAQRVEHYEMAAYGAVRTYADQLNYNEAKDLLQQTLDEEGEADKKLTSLAEGGFFKEGINVKAQKA